MSSVEEFDKCPSSFFFPFSFSFFFLFLIGINAHLLFNFFVWDLMKMGTHRVCLVLWTLGRMGKKKGQKCFLPKMGRKLGRDAHGQKCCFSFFLFHFFFGSNVASFFFLSLDFLGPRRDSCLSFFFSFDFLGLGHDNCFFFFFLTRLFFGTWFLFY